MLVQASSGSQSQMRSGGMPHPLLSSMSEPVLSCDWPVSRLPSVEALLSAPSKPAPYASLQQELPELHDDLIGEILARLDGRNRQAVFGSCKRLRDIAAETFTQLALAVPPSPAGTRSGSDRCGATAGSIDAYAAAAGTRMASMASITLLLPALPSTATQAKGTATATVAAAVDHCAAVEAFVTQSVAALPDGTLQAHTLSIKAAAEAQGDSSSPTPCQIGYDALAKLAVAAPNLRRLSLPLLSSPAAAALPLFTQQLSTLRVTVSDSPSLDHALQLTNLQHLSISTRKGLLYLVLSQRQLTDLARMSSLQTLTLNNVLINDCRASWEQLGSLASLRELSVSSPLSAERLALLPPSLQLLQLPFFSGSFESVGRPEVDIDVGDGTPLTGRGFGFGAPAELRCRQALTEGDLTALSRLPNLVKLQCDNVVVMDAAAAAVQAALVRANTLGQSACVALEAAAQASGLPVLPSVKGLHLSGYHSATGILGVMFPKLETLHVTSVTVPRPAPTHVAAMPHLHTLNWPSSGVLPAMLTASPGLSSLTVTGINCQQRLDELVHMAPPPQPRQQQQEQPAEAAKEQGSAAAQAAAAPKQESAGVSAAVVPTVGADGYWWPARLTDLTLCFSSTLRFRPKQVVTMLQATPAAMRDTVRTLCLRDQAQSHGPGRVVDDAVLAAALRSLPGIQRLQVVESGAVTDAGLCAALAEATGSLVSVSVAGCPKVTRAQAERVPCQLGRQWLEVSWLSEFGN